MRLLRAIMRVLEQVTLGPCSLEVLPFLLRRLRALERRALVRRYSITSVVLRSPIDGERILELCTHLTLASSLRRDRPTLKTVRLPNSGPVGSYIHSRNDERRSARSGRKERSPRTTTCDSVNRVVWKLSASELIGRFIDPGRGKAWARTICLLRCTRF